VYINIELLDVILDCMRHTFFFFVVFLLRIGLKLSEIIQMCLNEIDDKSFLNSLNSAVSCLGYLNSSSLTFFIRANTCQ